MKKKRKKGKRGKGVGTPRWSSSPGNVLGEFWSGPRGPPYRRVPAMSSATPFSRPRLLPLLPHLPFFLVVCFVLFFSAAAAPFALSVTEDTGRARGCACARDPYLRCLACGRSGLLIAFARRCFRFLLLLFLLVVVERSCIRCRGTAWEGVGVGCVLNKKR